MTGPPILIAGAGPTGLNLALGLARRGVPFRLVSDAAGPGEHSRAVVVQARTLEFYAQYGWAEAMVAQGIKVERVHLAEGDGRPGHAARERVTASFGDLGRGLSPYPFALAYPQDDHERFLLARLAELGVQPEWGVRLTGFTQDEAGVRATMERDGRSESAEADWLCGCDGAHSQVRRSLALDFPGGTYEQLFYVADVELDGPFDSDLHATLSERSFVLQLPVRSRGMQRLIGVAPPELSHKDGLAWEDVRPHVEPLLGAAVKTVNWFSHYRVHHRVAANFRVGRAFLLGDAGHIHSPAGGQGMNTGIGDAVNLAWKLAHVAQGRAPEALLDSYEPERIAFARTLVESTDRAFTPLVHAGLVGVLTRRVLAPLVMGLGTRIGAARHAMFRVVSQTRIHYPDSPLSEGKAGHVHGGDRLPWTGEGGTDNFAPLASLDWQAHVYGSASEEARSVAAAVGLPLHVFAWSEAAGHAGLAQDAVYLVRPDGHVGYAGDPAGLTAYAARIGLHGAFPAAA